MSSPRLFQLRNRFNPPSSRGWLLNAARLRALLIGCLTLGSLALAASPVEKSGYAGNQANDYATFANTLATVRALPRARSSSRDGWTIIEVPTPHGVSMWSFTPTGHPAHPSAVRRQVTFTSEGPLMDTKVLCEASTEQCRVFAAELRLSLIHI